MDETEKIIKEILDCAIESSKQEMTRSDILLKKSDYLMKYISAAFVIVNAISAFAVLRDYVPAWIVCIYYLLAGLLLLISMFFTIQAQTLLQVEYFPTGTQVLEGLAMKWQDEGKCYSLQDLQTDNIKYYSKYTDSLKKANDERAKKIREGYRFFMFATIRVAAGFLIFLIIIA